MESSLGTAIANHYMRPINMAPRLVSDEFVKGWHLCQLEVLECKKVPWPDSATEAEYSISDCGWPNKDYAYECKIIFLQELHIRFELNLQLVVHHWLVIDSMYMPAAIAEMANPELNPFGKCKKQFNHEDDESSAISEWILKYGKEPNVAIGLQACQISWDDGEHTYSARSPWWRGRIV